MGDSADGAANRSDGLWVRLVRSEEMARWRALMDAHHYLGFAHIVGQALHYVATVEEQWVALLGWGSAALKCGARDRWIGWSEQTHYQRLGFIANNVRFLVLPQAPLPHLASRVLALNLRRLSADWQQHHGQPIVLAETFVDSQRFRGTCYRAAGWSDVGTTQGYRKNNRHYLYHGTPKRVLLRPLIPRVQEQLCAPFLSPALRGVHSDFPMLDINTLPLDGSGSLLEMLHALTDPRRARGVRHSVATVVAIAVCAALSGARSFVAIGEWAAGLPPEILKRLGAKRPEPPSEPTIRRILQQIDAAALDQQIGAWLLRQTPLRGKAVAVDGKVLRNARRLGQRPVQLLSAILHQEGIVIAQQAIADKSNEIPALPEVLQPLDLAGAIVTADALHTQKNTARFLVEEKQADYLFIVKDNQPTLRENLEALPWQAFPPGPSAD